MLTRIKRQTVEWCAWKNNKLLSMIVGEVNSDDENENELGGSEKMPKRE